MTPEELQSIDHKLVRTARRVKILTTLTFPAEAERVFLEGVERGAPELPVVERPRPDLSQERKTLHRIRDRLDRGDPIQRFMRRTANSYLAAIKMLANTGTPTFTELSSKIYGSPKDPIAPGAPTHLDTAVHFALVSGCTTLPEMPRPLDSTQAAKRLQDGINIAFTGDPLPVEVDPDLTALATAGSRRVRLRGGERWSEMHVDQLLHHEALVHSATKRNGMRQPLLSCMGLSSPRTTATQEGLATLAEMITDTMDLRRLQRIAQRTVSVQAALDGADFIEVFRQFQESGSDNIESYRSAARVFRGGDVRGRVVFTKDIVYLRGLMQVHTFLLKSFQEGRHHVPRRLFSGRMTLSDVLDLEEAFDSGQIIEPAVVPSWVDNGPCLAAYLAWAAFNQRIPLEGLTAEDIDS